jgi:hypothetical protein
VGSARLYRGLQGQARSASHERNRVRGHALVAQSRSFQLHLSPRCIRARTNHLHHRSNNDLIYVFPAVRVFWCRSRSFVVLLNTPLRGIRILRIIPLYRRLQIYRYIYVSYTTVYRYNKSVYRYRPALTISCTEIRQADFCRNRHDREVHDRYR